MLIDTHVHLDDTRYDVDRDAVLLRAAEAGVVAMVSIGTNLEDSAWAASWTAGRDGLYATVGQHPEQVGSWAPGDAEKMEALTASKKVVAVGEVGLDYHSPGHDMAAQQSLFREMIRLALRKKLPLVIHQRDAANDTLAILKEEGGGSEGGVFHCFAGDWDCARGAMELGFDLAVGGILTFPSAKALREVIARVPLEKLVLETDGPWLAPQLYRGKRNEPAMIASVAAALAELKGVSLAELESATTANAKRIFRI
ncbi:MAG: TatD family hydrolase [candidate division FCPU426 bacterium]